MPSILSKGPLEEPRNREAEKWRARAREAEAQCQHNRLTLVLRGDGWHQIRCVDCEQGWSAQ